MLKVIYLLGGEQEFVEEEQIGFPSIDFPYSFPMGEDEEEKVEITLSWRELFDRDITIYEQEIDEMESTIKEFETPLYEINYSANPIETVMIESINILLKKYRIPAIEMDETEKEVNEFLGSNDSEDIEGEEDSGPPTVSRFGDTAGYCPVSLYNNGVLWKGKEEFQALYDNKLYFLSNEEALDEFLENPRKYIPLKEPPKLFPPLRICVIGPIGAGKTTLAKKLAKHYGLIYADFIADVDKYCVPSLLRAGRKSMDIFHVTGEEQTPGIYETASDGAKRAWQDVKSYYEEGVTLSGYMMRRVLDRLWKTEPYASTGFVVDAFPRCTNDVEYMVAHRLIPDLVISLSVHGGIAQQRIFEGK